MYPRFTDVVNDFFGTNFNLPIQTYGFFIALAFIIAGFVVFFELKRKECSGIISIQTKEILKGKPVQLVELLFAGFIYFLLGYKVIGVLIDYQLFAKNPQTYILSLKGSLIGGIAFFMLTVFLVYRKGQKEKLKEPLKVIYEVHAYQLTPGLIIIAAFAGILGAKIFDIIEHLDDFFRDPVGQVFAFSGLTFYGGLIVAAFAVGIYGERNKIKWPIMADAVAPALMLAYAVGRVGCQLSGDGCWGVPNLSPKPGWMAFLPDWMWAFNFPHNVINHGVMIPGCAGIFCFALAQPVFPTSFYETVICVLFFLILWFIRKRIRIAGILFSIYLILNGFERFVIEQVRVNIKYQVLNFQITQAEIIALILIFAGISGLVFFFIKTENFYKKMSDRVNLQLLTLQVVNLARATGIFLKNEINKLSIKDIESKGAHDFVSYVDKTAEKQIIGELRKLLPEAGFIAEESTDLKPTGRFNWVVDPLDGTTNFIHRLPLFSISIALMEKDEIISGVVFEPNQNECFYAWKGSPAYLNQDVINVSQPAKIGDCLFATGFPYYDYSRLDNYMELFKFLLKNSHGIRRLGSAAVDLAYVACGRFEGFYEYGLHPWDVAAGALIVKQAGGKVSDFSGDGNFVFGREIVATNHHVYNEFMNEIKKYFDKN